MLRGQSQKEESEVDSLIQWEYQRYREAKKRTFIGSGHKKAEKFMKENMQNNQSPESLSFGRIKEMNQSELNLQKILKKLNVESCQQALEKISRVNAGQKFLGRIKEMIQRVYPQQEPNLKNSWRIIKQVMLAHELKKVQNSS